jgi:hypothetical protein
MVATTGLEVKISQPSRADSSIGIGAGKVEHSDFRKSACRTAVGAVHDRRSKT